MTKEQRQLQNSIQAYLNKENVHNHFITKYQEAVLCEADEDVIEKLFNNCDLIESQLIKVAKRESEFNGMTTYEFIDAVNAETERRAMIKEAV